MDQISMFDLMYPTFKTDNPVRLIELFAGVGSQAMALRNLGVPFEHYLMGQMERGHTAEVQPDCMTEAYTVGISETHIRNNATVFRVWQMIERGELTREEGLYLMANTLADENHRLNQMCNNLIMRMPSRLLVETITGKN